MEIYDFHYIRITSIELMAMTMASILTRLRLPMPHLGRDAVRNDVGQICLNGLNPLQTRRGVPATTVTFLKHPNSAPLDHAHAQRASKAKPLKWKRPRRIRWPDWPSRRKRRLEVSAAGAPGCTPMTITLIRFHRYRERTEPGNLRPDGSRTGRHRPISVIAV
jgi:hypothetical protein